MVPTPYGSHYPLPPDRDCRCGRVWQGRVTACTLVSAEALQTQHTMGKVK